MTNSLKRIETEGLISDLKIRTFFIKNATIEELLACNLKPEVRAARNPVCEMLQTRSFVMCEQDCQNFCRRLRNLVQGHSVSKWIINSWQLQIVSMNFEKPVRNEQNLDVINFPESWEKILSLLSGMLKILDLTFDMMQLQVGAKDVTDSIHIVLPVIKICSMCPKLTSLRVQCDFNQGVKSEENKVDLALDTWIIREHGLPLREIILKGVKCSVAIEMAKRSAQDKLEKFSWQRIEPDSTLLDLPNLMNTVCGFETITEMEIFASNFPQSPIDELFHASPDSMDYLEKVRIYMFTMEPNALHSIGSIVMTKIDHLREVSVWCEDEISDEESMKSVIYFLEFVASCQKNLKKLYISLPLKSKNLLNSVKGILSSCRSLESFVFGVSNKDQSPEYQSLAKTYKIFIPVMTWKDGTKSSEGGIKAGSDIKQFYELRGTFKKLDYLKRQKSLASSTR